MTRHSERAFVAVLGLIAAYLLIWPFWRAFFPMEITTNEGWNAYYQDAALHGTLYPPADALIVNNYPPLSFYGIGWLSQWFGDSLYVGRAISALSVLGLGIVIALAVRRLGSGKIAAAIASTWFVAVIAGSFNRFVAMNDPQLFAQFIMTGALVWFLARDRHGLSAVPPVLLMVVAGFIKHNIVVIPATVLLWLALRDGRRALLPIMAGVLAALAGLLICFAVYGEAFASNMLAVREYRLLRILSSVGRLQWVIPAMVIWAIWAWHARQTPVARFTALYIAIGLLVYLVQWAGEGVVDNAQFDLVIAVAIGLGVAYEHIGEIKRAPFWSIVRLRALVVGILVIRLLATGRIESFLILFDPAYRAQFPIQAAIVESETKRVAAIKGDVWCTLKVICRRAGKPFAGDDFKVEQMLATGKITKTELDVLLKNRGITYATIDERAETISLNRDLVRMWWFGDKS